MQKKNLKEETGMSAVSIIILVAVAVLILGVIILGLGAIGTVLNNSTNNNVNYNTSSSSDTNNTVTDNAKNTAVLNGFKFTIPEGVNCKVNVPNVSLILETEDMTIQMVLKVTDGSYEEVMKNPESLMSSAKTAGYEITESIKEVTINGTKCAYYTCEGQGLHNLVAYTRGNNAKKISVQAVIDKEYDTKVLDLFTKLTSTVVETLEANSTDEELASINEGKKTAVEYDISYTKEVTSVEQAIDEIKAEAERQRKKYNNPEISSIEKEIEEKYDITAVVLGEMDTETAKIVDDAFSITFRLFPELKGKITNVTIGNSISKEPTALARVKQSMFITSPNSAEYPIVVKNEILLEARYFLNPERMENTVKGAAATGFWDEGATPQSLVAHELGHALIDLIREGRYAVTDSVYISANNYQNYVNFLVDKNETKQITAKEIVTNAYNRYGENITFDDFLNSISGYAASKDESTGVYKYEEACAEAYADYYIHGINCAKASRLIMEDVVANYNKYCKGQ